MGILNDIANIVKCDKEHNLRICTDKYGITVYLEFDQEYCKSEIIPIQYSVDDKFAYIPHDELIKKYIPGDYGIDKNEVKLILWIMDYLENHKDEIQSLCTKFDLEYR